MLATLGLLMTACDGPATPAPGDAVNAAASTAPAAGTPNAAGSSAPAGAPAVVSPAGGQAQSGLWESTAIDGISGNKLTFRVSADGSRLEDVTFTGHWRCGPTPSSRTIKVMDVPHVPGAFTVTAGTFSEVKKEPYLAWTFEGRFTSATEATGTFRAEYDIECDTHAINWTARPVGP
jgi:hypothetical protein